MGHTLFGVLPGKFEVQWAIESSTRTPSSKMSCSKCYALCKNWKPCRNYARPGEFTCRQHRYYFCNYEGWIEDMLYTNHRLHFWTIRQHVKEALQSGAYKAGDHEITALHLQEHQDHTIHLRKEDEGRVWRGPRHIPLNPPLVLLFLRYCPKLRLTDFPATTQLAVYQDMMKSLMSYHRTFLPIDETPQDESLQNLHTYLWKNTTSILSTWFRDKFDCVVRADGRCDALWAYVRILNARTDTIGTPYGSRLVWKSFVMNFLERYGSHEEVQRAIWFTEDNEVFDPKVRTWMKYPFYHIYIQECRKVWSAYRQEKRAEALREAKKRTGAYKEDLMAATWHPDRMIQWCLDLEEYEDLRSHWMGV